MKKEDLYNHLKNNSQVLQNEVMRKAFEVVNRADFVGADYEPEAYEDYTLPLVAGETITKPTLIAFMLELLNVKPGDNVLEVGSGSGWVIALLAEMVGKNGKVTGTEIIPDLVKRGTDNIAKYKIKHAVIVQADKTIGHSVRGPYDKILCTSNAVEVPEALIDQLKSRGTIVIPIEGMIVRGIKKKGEFEMERFPGTFMFEPLK